MGKSPSRCFKSWIQFRANSFTRSTRRAIDRLAATISSDKYVHPSSVEFFSPAVTRPLSTATDVSNISHSSSENSYVSQESGLTHLSSPTTLISEYDDDLNHRRRLLDEDEDILIGRAQLNDENEEGDDSMQQDHDERFERLSLLLTSVLKEANEAIRDYEAIHEGAEGESAIEVGEMVSTSSRCPSRLSTTASTVTGSAVLSPVERDIKPLVYTMPSSLQSQETIKAVALQPPTAPPTPPPFDSASSRPALLNPDSRSDSITSSVETIRPLRHSTPESEWTPTNEKDDTFISPEDVPLPEDESLEAPPELTLDYLLGDYLNEVIMDVRRSEFVGPRFWIFLLSVMGMWNWMWITSWACSCKA